MTTRLSDDDAALVADIAAANRPALVETWIQDCPHRDLMTLVIEEVAHDQEFINAVRACCYAYDAARSHDYTHAVLGAARTIARLVRHQADRCHGDELVDAEIQRSITKDQS